LYYLQKKNHYEILDSYKNNIMSVAVALEHIEYDEDIREQEEVLATEDDTNEIPPMDIVAFNELRSCADIVRMYKNGQLNIQPDFQRDVVWSNASKTRFVDSLIKQLPIPSMCISLDYRTDERLVIDGLQRISSIISFLTDDDWKLSKLADVDTKISGKTVGYIKEKLTSIFERVENLTIPITVLRCDYSKKSHKQYLFTIFHRLNTGGNKLTNQEIRNCIYAGKLNILLRELVQYENFRLMLDLEEGVSYRFAYEELILRLFAFSEKRNDYKGGLANFLNNYMDDNKELNEVKSAQKRHNFQRTIDLLYLRILNETSLPKISKTTKEAILVGVYSNINDLENIEDRELKEMLDNLRNDDLFSLENLKEGLSGREKVQVRLERAVNIFNPNHVAG